MADRSTFTAEEWNQVMQGVMAAGIAVTAADPSGLWGMLKEGMASSRALLALASARSAAAEVPTVAASAHRTKPHPTSTKPAGANRLRRRIVLAGLRYRIGVATR